MGVTHYFSILPGTPNPLGISYLETGVNFAVYSKHATALSLCLFPPGLTEPIEICLDPTENRTGDVWHVQIEHLPPNYRYGYRVDGPFEPELGHRFDNRHILLDPYARLIDAPTDWGKKQTYLGIVGPADESFDWEEDTAPRIPFKDLIIYEMHVRGFTQDPSSRVKEPGTFLGLIEKIPYLKKLGINAVELMPLHEFREWDNAFINPLTGEALCNYWGYSTVSFFAPMRRYGTAQEFKQMVKALHKVGIEVIMDVVYNHTAEGDQNGPTLHFRGLENSVYYMLTPEEGHYYNFTGCGNTVACNHTVVRDLIRASLRYWVQEMHVDGFRFDLASIFCRDRNGAPLHHPPIVEELANDPILAHTKLIAEAWDAGGMYQVGSFPHFGKWADWNGKFRDQVRRFIKGTDGETGNFTTRMCGSEDLYGGRFPYHSINFVTAHDGFSLADLVSYNQKHNEANGEGNRDGDNNNESWNCGAEGKTDDAHILALRERQMKNFFLALFASQGVPMLLMGDEYGHTKEGNNNSWGHDGRLNWFQWDSLEKASSLFEFCRRMIEIRKSYPILHRAYFLNKKDVIFHGTQPQKPDWAAASRFIAFTLRDRIGGYRLYFAFNASYKALEVTFPKLITGSWELLIDTATQWQPTRPAALPAYSKRMVAQSALLLVANAPHER